MSDYDPVERSTDLDGYGHAPVVELDICAKWCGHGMEEVRGSNPLSSTHLTRTTSRADLDHAAAGSARRHADAFDLPG
jgi:hypothetical protein